MVLRLGLVATCLLALASAVDHSTFRTCEQVPFCSRLRDKESSDDFTVDASSVNIGASAVSVNLIAEDETYLLTIYAIQDDTFRVTLEDIEHERYKVTDSLKDDPRLASIDAVQLTGNISIEFGNGNRAVARSSPLVIEFYKNDVLFVVLNGNGRFTFEERNEEGEEAIAFDVEFPSAARLYGIPEHADRLALRNTSTDLGIDPYRLYNLDVAFYEIDSTMALYGAIPVLYGHGTSGTSGIFFNNAAEQWVDISGNSAYFMAESGSLDIFVFLGPTPELAVQQYANLTGVTNLPQYWTLGYHQCRWNYVDQEDVKYVIAQLDNYNFSVDVIWLDIDYTDAKKYFTWDPVNFADPIEMQSNLSSTNRKLVTIIDPHIKVEEGYFVYDGALENDYFVKTADGDIYEGDCWPGLSSYIDFLNPAASDYVSGLYSYDKFNYSTPTLAGIWNDMNEPSVFDDSIEKTLPKDTVHYGDVEHREIHNMYGFLQTRSTYQGLVARDSGTKRPFLLTRSHFAGSQRFVTVWTGDNTADWGYLSVSYPMCLAENLVSIAFCGADVGGFFYNPEEELVQRWYQAGIWLPFYRAHANNDTERREPYLFSEETQDIIRDALDLRYAHIPYWYTLFFEHSQTARPVVRPLFYHYPSDSNVFDIDEQLLVGRDIMSRLIAEEGATTASVYFPGGSNEFWFDIESPLVYSGNGFTDVSLSKEFSPYFYRSGSIIARKDTHVRNTVEQQEQAYVVYVFADTEDNAYGTLYIDDGESFDYQDKVYNYYGFEFNNGSVTINDLDSEASYPDGSLEIDHYVVYRVPSSAERELAKGPVVPERTEYYVDKNGEKFQRITDVRSGPVRISLY